jgi:hypothetical protein
MTIEATANTYPDRSTVLTVVDTESGLRVWV